MPANLKRQIASGELEELAAEYGMDSVTEVGDLALAPDLLEHLPVEWAREHCMLPVRLNGRECLLTCEPDDVERHGYVALLTGLELHPVLAPETVILDCIDRSYFRQESSPSDYIDDLDENETSDAGSSHEVNDLLQGGGEVPVTRMLNLILLDAYKRNSSDIHLEPFENRLRVRYRIDGVLYEQPSPPANMMQALVSRLKVMAHMDIAERRLPQDGMARVKVGDREVDIRVSTVPVSEGERVVLRLLDKRNILLSLSDLGMQGETESRFRSLLGYSNGIIIVSGPTGSGKTTTLYAALGEIDASRKNILTVEDPIEYRLDNVGQIQVKPKIGLNFSNGLRHILRQDPDVILVGETRDRETAEIAIRAALTGHLVFTTLHTNDAAGAVVRLTDMGIAPYLLASSLRGVLAQRLVRRLCPVCRSAYTVTEDDDFAGKIGGIPAGKRIWKAAGCERCTDGYRGRVGIFELLTVTPRLRDVIRESDFNQTLLQEAALREGAGTLLDDGIEKIINGATSIEEVLSITSV